MALASTLLSTAGATAAEPARPRLVVVVVVDQMRGDFVERFDADAGLRRLRERGFSYLDAHHDHLPTETGPGHAALSTGAPPGVNGIAGNDFLVFDAERRAGRVEYCVSDPGARIVGSSSESLEPVSPRRLEVSTVTDELERTTSGSAKTLAMAYKDRAAILMGGHGVDLALWLDSRAGSWVTSTWYTDELPDWVVGLNAGKLAGADDAVVPRLAELARRSPRWEPLGGGEFESEHVIARHRDYLRSGLSNEYLFASAEAAVRALELGRDDVPDLLWLGLSTNDYVGHVFGPDSAEVRDTHVRMDLLLGGFLDFLDDVIGAGRYVLALTADHGVVPIPPLPGEPPGRRVSSAGRLDPGEVVRAVEAALDRTFGAADWVLALEGPNLYLDRHVPPADGHAAEAIERVAARAAMGVRGLFLAVPRTALLDGRPPATPLAKRIANGFHPRHSGDVIVVRRAGWHRPISGRTRTGHGGVWAHETHVPLILAGPGIRQGSSAERVSSLDLAPTLSRLLAIPYPSGCQGEPLAEALRPITPWPDKGP